MLRRLRRYRSIGRILGRFRRRRRYRISMSLLGYSMRIRRRYEHNHNSELQNLQIRKLTIQLNRITVGLGPQPAHRTLPLLTPHRHHHFPLLPTLKIKTSLRPVTPPPNRLAKTQLILIKAQTEPQIGQSLPQPNLNNLQHNRMR